MNIETPSPSAETDETRRAAILRWLGPLTVLALLAGALAVFHHELRDFRYHDVVRAARALQASRLALAVALTVVAYVVLFGYDALALLYAGRPLPIRRLGLASFLSYGLSQTLGFPLLTGGAVRARLWSAWGLSGEEVAQAMGFVGATFTVGVVAASGLVFLLEPSATVELIHLPVTVARVGGSVCLAVVAAYVGWSIGGRGVPIRVGGLQFPVPAPRLAVAQIALAVVDWAIAGSVLYVLLPSGHGLTFLAFLGAFLLAQFAGILSHVPGGLGVFETLVVLLLGDRLPASTIVAALLAYRVIYYLLPFTIAVLLLVGTEVARQRARVTVAASAVGAIAARWVPPLIPYVLGGATFIAGAVLLASGATPAAHSRVRWLNDILPLGVIELSHFVASLVGAGLIILAWALTRRLDAAWALTVALLGVGIVTSLLKGLAWEEALALSLVLVALVPSRRAFYRKAMLTSEPFSPGWLVAVLVVIGVTTWLGFFSYKHVEYSNELWWRFTVRGDAPRFLRATVGAFGVLLVFGLLRLLRHAPAKPPLPAAADLERARAVIAHSPRASANLALLGDKALLFSESGRGVLMYGVAGRSWVALGDPIGPPSERTELAWRFREEADRHGAWTVFYEVLAENLPIYIDLGLSLLKLGEEARVPLDTLSLDGSNRKGLRRAQRTVQKAGAVFQVAPPERVPALLPELQAISDAWLVGKATREKGFSMGRFDARYLCHFPVALVCVNGKLVAFANLWLGAEHEECSVDLMRYSPDAPQGIMLYLFTELLLWAKEQGYHWFNLGMAPMSGLQNRALAPLWHRVGALLFRHGEHFYNFQGLRYFKERFYPVWVPKYLASPGGLLLPRILANVATLISGSLRGVVAK